MEYKIAVFADVHGNFTALNAVYKDMKYCNVDSSWFLGDLFMPGSGSQDLWELMKKIGPDICIRGNWEDLLVNGIKGDLYPSNPSRLYMCKLAEDLSYRLDANVVNDISRWPLKKTVQIFDTNISLTHNLSNINYGQYLYPLEGTEHFDKLFDNSDIDISIYAHVHHPLLRYSSNEQLVLNPGSVGEIFFKHAKFQKDLRAEYLILILDKSGIKDIDFRKVSYNHNEEINRAKKLHIPYFDLYKKQLKTGESHTHDNDLLFKINKEMGYVNDVNRYIRDRRRLK